MVHLGFGLGCGIDIQSVSRDQGRGVLRLLLSPAPVQVSRKAARSVTDRLGDEVGSFVILSAPKPLIWNGDMALPI